MVLYIQVTKNIATKYVQAQTALVQLFWAGRYVIWKNIKYELPYRITWITIKTRESSLNIFLFLVLFAILGIVLFLGSNLYWRRFMLEDCLQYYLAQTCQSDLWKMNMAKNNKQKNKNIPLFITYLHL